MHLFVYLLNFFPFTKRKGEIHKDTQEPKIPISLYAKTVRIKSICSANEVGTKMQKTGARGFVGATHG